MKQNGHGNRTGCQPSARNEHADAKSLYPSFRAPNPNRSQA